MIAFLFRRPRHCWSRRASVEVSCFPANTLRVAPRSASRKQERPVGRNASVSRRRQKGFRKKKRRHTKGSEILKAPFLFFFIHAFTRLSCPTLCLWSFARRKATGEEKGTVASSMGSCLFFLSIEFLFPLSRHRYNVLSLVCAQRGAIQLETIDGRRGPCVRIGSPPLCIPPYSTDGRWPRPTGSPRRVCFSPPGCMRVHSTNPYGT